MPRCKWAESLAAVAQTQAPDADYAAVAAMFGEREIGDLTLAVSLMNAFNRIGVGLRMAPKAAAQAVGAVSA